MPQAPRFLRLAAVCKSEALLTLEEDQVRNQLSKMNLHKSMGPGRMHLRVLCELADTVLRLNGRSS